MRRHTLPLALVAIVLAGLVACSSGRSHNPFAPQTPVALALQLVESSLDTPVLVTAPPGDTGRLFVVQKTGKIVILKNDSLMATPFLDLTGQVATGYEEGLLGLAFDPLYSANGRFFVYFVDVDGNEHLMRYGVSPNPDVALPTPMDTVLTIIDPDPGHNAGMLAFGPDGKLWLSVGDGGGVGDPFRYGQTKDDLFGSLIRIDVSSGSGYTSPPDNPYSGADRRELWNVGLRNPWRFSFDRQTGDLYIGDVGQDTWEEIDVAPAASGRGRGANYGWSIMEGNHCYNSATCNSAGLTPPTIEWTHAGGACTAIGGYVYRGSRIPALRGTYFYGDYCGQWVRSFRYSGGVTQATSWPALGPGDNILSFGEDAAGELYICTESGNVYRIVPAPVPQTRATLADDPQRYRGTSRRGLGSR